MGTLIGGDTPCNFLVSYVGASWEGAVCAPLESAVAEDGRFSSGARTFRTTCASAAGEAVMQPLGRPALASQEDFEMNCRILCQAGVKHV